MTRIRGDLKQRTVAFTVCAMKTLALLPRRTEGRVVGKQFFRAVSSIGADVWEADAAFSESDFAYRMSTARKEASEPQYWLELAEAGDLLPREMYEPLRKEAAELTSILTAIVTAIVRKSQAHLRAGLPGARPGLP